MFGDSLKSYLTMCSKICQTTNLWDRIGLTPFVFEWCFCLLKWTDANYPSSSSVESNESCRISMQRQLVTHLPSIIHVPGSRETSGFRLAGLTTCFILLFQASTLIPKPCINNRFLVSEIFLPFIVLVKKAFSSTNLDWKGGCKLWKAFISQYKDEVSNFHVSGTLQLSLYRPFLSIWTSIWNSTPDFWKKLQGPWMKRFKKNITAHGLPNAIVLQNEMMTWLKNVGWTTSRTSKSKH